MSNIYGVDTDKKVVPVMVRDAMTKCFYAAHCAQSGIGDQSDKVTEDYCLQIIKKAFNETSGDFENPTKTQLAAVMNWLANFSKSFRNQEIILSHMSDIQKLVDLVGD